MISKVNTLTFIFLLLQANELFGEPDVILFTLRRQKDGVCFPCKITRTPKKLDAQSSSRNDSYTYVVDDCGEGIEIISSTTESYDAVSQDGGVIDRGLEVSKNDQEIIFVESKYRGAAPAGENLGEGEYFVHQINAKNHELVQTFLLKMQNEIVNDSSNVFHHIPSEYLYVATRGNDLFGLEVTSTTVEVQDRTFYTFKFKQPVFRYRRNNSESSLYRLPETEQIKAVRRRIFEMKVTYSKDLTEEVTDAITKSVVILVYSLKERFKFLVKSSGEKGSNNYKMFKVLCWPKLQPGEYYLNCYASEISSLQEKRVVRASRFTFGNNFQFVVNWQMTLGTYTHFTINLDLNKVEYDKWEALKHLEDWQREGKMKFKSTAMIMDVYKCSNKGELDLMKWGDEIYGVAAGGKQQCKVFGGFKIISNYQQQGHATEYLKVVSRECTVEAFMCIDESKALNQNDVLLKEGNEKINIDPQGVYLSIFAKNTSKLLGKYIVTEIEVGENIYGQKRKTELQMDSSKFKTVIDRESIANPEGLVFTINYEPNATEYNWDVVKFLRCDGKFTIFERLRIRVDVNECNTVTGELLFQQMNQKEATIRNTTPRVIKLFGIEPEEGSTPAYSKTYRFKYISSCKVVIVYAKLITITYFQEKPCAYFREIDELPNYALSDDQYFLFLIRLETIQWRVPVEQIIHNGKCSLRVHGVKVIPSYLKERFTNVLVYTGLDLCISKSSEFHDPDADKPIFKRTILDYDKFLFVINDPVVNNIKTSFKADHSM